jgi:hypothetical protein
MFGRNAVEQDFWGDKKGWPRDTDEHVFLGRAIEKIGAAIFGDKWTGSEPSAAADSAEREKFQGVQDAIVRAFTSGRLDFVLRGISGGIFLQQNAAYWHTEALEERFLTCRINTRIHSLSK